MEGAFNKYMADSQSCPGLLSTTLTRLRGFIGDLYALGYTSDVEAPSIVKLGMLDLASDQIVTELSPLFDQAKREADIKGREAYIQSLPKAQRVSERICSILKMLYRNAAGVYFGLIIVRARITQFFLLDLKKSRGELLTDKEKLEYEVGEILLVSLCEHGGLATVVDALEIELDAAHIMVSKMLINSRGVAIGYKSKIKNVKLDPILGLNSKVQELVPLLMSLDTTQVAAEDVTVDVGTDKTLPTLSNAPKLTPVQSKFIKSKYLEKLEVRLLSMVFIVGDWHQIWSC